MNTAFQVPTYSKNTSTFFSLGFCERQFSEESAVEKVISLCIGFRTSTRSNGSLKLRFYQATFVLRHHRRRVAGHVTCRWSESVDLMQKSVYKTNLERFCPTKSQRRRYHVNVGRHVFATCPLVKTRLYVCLLYVFVCMCAVPAFSLAKFTAKSSIL